MHFNKRRWISIFRRIKRGSLFWRPQMEVGWSGLILQCRVLVLQTGDMEVGWWRRLGTHMEYEKIMEDVLQYMHYSYLLIIFYSSNVYAYLCFI